jgi:hypothetical protein
LLKYHFHIQNPELLSDDEWAENYHQLMWVLGFEAKRFSLEKGEKLAI